MNTAHRYAECMPGLKDCASLMAGRSGAEWLWRMIYSSMQGRYCSRPKNASAGEPTFAGVA